MAPLPDAQHAPIAALVPELDRLAVDVMADWKVPGAALAVVQDGKVSFATAHGHWSIEANLPATTATQIRDRLDNQILHRDRRGAPAQ
jgi:CubicO group peptidase (beta-lactamase class C family)